MFCGTITIRFRASSETDAEAVAEQIQAALIDVRLPESAEIDEADIWEE